MHLLTNQALWLFADTAVYTLISPQMYCCNAIRLCLEPVAQKSISQAYLLHRFDDLRNYSNERSLYLAQLRHSIEEPWQQWESSHFDIQSYKSKTVEQVL